MRSVIDLLMRTPEGL